MARTVTLSQLRTDVSVQCDFTIGASGRYTPTILTRYLNQSVQRFRERISNEGMTHYLVSTTGTVTSGATSPYAFKSLDISAAAPNVVRVYGVDLTVNGIVKTLAHRPFQERNDYGAPSITGEPMAWAMYQTTSIALMPAPGQSYSYTVWYLPLLADMVADGDTFDGVAGWEQWIVWDVVCQLIARDTYQSAYAQAAQLRTETWQDIIRSSTKVTSAGGAIIGRDTLRAGGFGRRAFSGPVVSGGSGLPPDGSVTNAMLATAPEATIKGRARGAGAGSPTDLVPEQVAAITAVYSGGAAGLVPTGSGNPLLFLTQAATWAAPSVGGSVSGLEFSQIQNVSPDRVLGRSTAGTGAVEQLRGQQVASMIGVFTGAAHGLVPMPTGGFGAGAFLRDDATWATPAGGAGGGGPTMLAGGPANAVQYNGGSGLAGASGLLFAPETGVQLNGNLRMPTGTVLLGATGAEGTSVGWLGADNGAVNLGLGTATGSPVLSIDRNSGSFRFRTWDNGGGAREWGRVNPVGSGSVALTLGVDSSSSVFRGRGLVNFFASAPSGVIRGSLGANAVDAFAALPGHHTWSVSGAQKLGLDNDGLSVWGKLGVQPLAHGASSDKLASWTASGFANIATGIQITASGTSLEFGPAGPVLSGSGIDMRSGAIANYAPSGITLAQFAAIPATTILGRTSPSGIPQALTPSAVATMMPLFNTVDKGLVPAPGVVSGNFLKDDGTWASTAAGAATGVANAMMLPMPPFSIKGRNAISSGIPQDLLIPAVASMLPNHFGGSGTTRGLVFAPTGGAAGNFLRDDGSWQSAGGGGGGPTMLAGGPAQAVQYNGGSGLAGASGFLFHAGSGIDLHGRLHMPTGVIRIGDMRGSEPGGVSSGMLKFTPSMVDVIVGISSAGLNAQLMQWGVDGTDALTLGRNVAVRSTWGRSAFEHRRTIAGANKEVLDADHFGLDPTVRLGVAKLAHSATTDKLASWTASGFANIATGISIGASGYQLSIGSGGPQLHASGIDMRSGVIENAKRIGGLDGIKLYGFISGGGAASGSQNIVSASGSAFVISPDATTGQKFSLVPTLATAGDALIIDNRSSVAHSIFSAVGTGGSIASGLIVSVSPSMGVKCHFASGAWAFRDRYQLGGY